MICSLSFVCSIRKNGKKKKKKKAENVKENTRTVEPGFFFFFAYVYATWVALVSLLQFDILISFLNAI